DFVANLRQQQPACVITEAGGLRLKRADNHCAGGKPRVSNGMCRQGGAQIIPEESAPEELIPEVVAGRSGLPAVFEIINKGLLFLTIASFLPVKELQNETPVLPDSLHANNCRKGVFLLHLGDELSIIIFLFRYYKISIMLI